VQDEEKGQEQEGRMIQVGTSGNPTAKFCCPNKHSITVDKPRSGRRLVCLKCGEYMEEEMWDLVFLGDLFTNYIGPEEPSPMRSNDLLRIGLDDPRDRDYRKNKAPDDEVIDELHRVNRLWEQERRRRKGVSGSRAWNAGQKK
jgi:hypothetical protein